jgi:NAD(P)-dependent dehydrogenase (short-subunit alcohol dehydrogenase family)
MSSNTQQQPPNPARRDFANKCHAASYDYISPLKLDLSGRHVLITGAAHEDGVGFATALAFARAGASVIVLADLRGVAEERAESLRVAAKEAGRQDEPVVLCREVDIAKLDSVKALLESVETSLGGRLDVLVNNAAHQEPYAKLLDSDPEVDWRTWEVNVNGLVNMSRTFLPLLLAARNSNSESNSDSDSNSNSNSDSDSESRRGLCTMINVSSSGALSVRPGSSHYRSSKLAVLRYTESLQLDYSQEGLVCYCVNPGAIKTQITINEPAELRDRLPHKVDIAGDTICWLASERREWLGGRYVSCPWDMEELMSRREEIVEGDKLKVRMVY